jgi:hypothetical protein
MSKSCGSIADVGLARSTRDLLNITHAIAEAGAGFKVLDNPALDTTSAHGKLGEVRALTYSSDSGRPVSSACGYPEAVLDDKQSVAGVARAYFDVAFV